MLMSPPVLLLALFLLLLLACGPSSASTLIDAWQAEQQPTSPGRLPSASDCLRTYADSIFANDGRTLNSSYTTAAQIGPTRLRSSLPPPSAALGAAGETALTVGELVEGTLPSYGDMAYFSYKPAALNTPFDLFVSFGGCDSGYCDIHVLMSGEAFANFSTATWDAHYSTALRFDSSHPLSCEYRNLPLDSCEYHYTLYTYSAEQRYSVVITSPPAGVPQLTSGRAQNGTLGGGGSAYYYITNGALEDVMVFALTATEGDCDLYVSTTTERPGPDEYTWSSVDDGDDLVVVNGSTAGPGGRRGMYYFLGVHNKRASSSSAYSLVGSGYSTSGDPLYNAGYLTADVSQRDYAMAGTYRYYYVYVEGVWPVMTITLDSMRGDADMSASNSTQPAF